MTSAASTSRGPVRPVDTLIVALSMRNPESLLAALPFLRYFGERGLSELAVLRDPTTRVILVNTEEIDQWIIDRTLRDLSAGDERARRSMEERLDCLVPSACGAAPLAEAVLADPGTLERLQDALRSSRSAMLVNYGAFSETDELAARLGIPAEEGPAGPAELWGTKAGGKSLLHEAQVLCPPGELEVVRSVEAATAAAHRLATADPQTERVIVRLSTSEFGDGLGNAIVRCSTLLRTGDLRRAIDSMHLSWAEYCGELELGGAIVEHHIESATCWPSAQAIIGRDGVLSVLAVHEQIMVGDAYRGCRFPVDAALAEPVIEAMRRVGGALQRHGFRGSFGVDFLAAGGRTYATEINIRKLGPSHVIKAVADLAAAGGAVSGHGAGSIIGLPIAYVHRWLHDPGLYTALTPASALEALRSRGLAYDPQTRTGTLLHIMGGLRAAGYVETTSVARTAAEANEVDERAVAALTDAAHRALNVTSR
jgi:hypothetical protein